MQNILRSALPHSPIFSGAMFTVLVYSCLVVYLYKSLPHIPEIEAKDTFAATSVAISLIFAFRINSAYDRWWEARKLWGQLVNDLRNLSIKFDLYFDADEKEKTIFGNLLIAFAFSLKHHLRSLRYNPAWAGISLADQGVVNVPLHLAKLVFAAVEGHRKKSSHDRLQLLLLDSHMRALLDICGACERIRGSRIAGWFQASIWVWLITYLTLLPWLIAGEFGWATVVITLFAAYFGIAVELIAEEIQEPFGCDPNDLPLDAICLTIAQSVQQILRANPPDVKAMDGLTEAAVHPLSSSSGG